MKILFMHLELVAVLLTSFSLVAPAGARSPTLSMTNDSVLGPRVFWPVANAGYSLQWTPSLAPISWQLYPATPALSGDGNSLVVNVSSLEASNPVAFFVLVSNYVAVSAPPSVVTVAASPVNYTDAELIGTVLANLLDTTWWFQWGLDATYGQTTASSVVSGSNTTAVTVQIGITGLSPGTTYHFQLYGSNSDGISSGGDLILTTPTALPDAIVQTFAASNITSTSAQLNGSVNPNGTELVGWFQWGTTTSYGNDTPNFYESGDFQVVGESYTLTNLTPNTTYHYQIVAYNSGPTEALGNDVVFTTSSPVQQSPPTVTIQAASSVGSSCATLNGSVNPNGAATTYYFVYGSGGTVSQTATFSVGSGSSAASVQATVCGLTPNTLYGCFLYAANSGGSASSGTDGFTTTAASQAPPTVTTLAASSLTPTSATLNGDVNGNGDSSTSAYFEWGTTTSYGTITIQTGVGGAAQSFTATLTNLAPSTTYHYRIDAANTGGTSDGSDATFTTSSAQAPPTVLTLAAGGITDTGATVNAFVDPNGADTHAYFQYGTTTSYGNTTALADVGSSTNQQLFQSIVSSVNLNTTYHYRIVAYNSAGTSYGADAAFTTLPLPPSVTTEAATGIQGAGNATLNASANPNGASTTVYFQYGLNTNYGSTTSGVNIGSGASTQQVATSIDGLQSYTIYHFRAVAASAGGTVAGADMSFNSTGIQ